MVILVTNITIFKQYWLFIVQLWLVVIPAVTKTVPACSKPEPEFRFLKELLDTGLRRYDKDFVCGTTAGLFPVIF